MFHTKKPFHLLAGQAVRVFSNYPKHLFAQEIELIAHTLSSVDAGVNAVVRCCRMVEKWRVVSVHK